MTSYRTTKTSIGRFFIPIESALNSIGSMDTLNGSTLLIATVGVGNVAQIAMDILLTTLSAKGKILKIGYINDRNIVSGVGNDAFTAISTKKKGIAPKGRLHCPVEVYWCFDWKMVLIQQRCAVRTGGRGEYVNGMMQFMDRYGFGNVVVMTSEYITKRTESETKKNVKMVYFHSEQFDGDSMESMECTKLEGINGMNDDEKEQKQNGQVADGKQESRIVGHGISRKLYEQCVKDEKSAVVVCRYTEDGDNTGESVVYLKNVVQVIDSLDDSDTQLNDIQKWKMPYSLTFANGGKLPNCIY